MADFDSFILVPTPAGYACVRVSAIVLVRDVDEDERNALAPKANSCILIGVPDDFVPLYASIPAKQIADAISAGVRVRG